MASIVTPIKADLLQTLPSDAARHIQWRFAERYDLQMLVQSARAVALRKSPLNVARCI